ncbi:MAG: ExbD/TolR family protein [Salibacteraceae bacterium]
MKRRRKTPTIAAGSMADIAFLLLVFFLVTTTVDTELGLMRLLPFGEDSGVVHERNVLEVLVNADNELLVEDQKITIEELRQLAKTFIQNAEDRADLPLRVEKDIPLLGPIMVSKQVISLQNHGRTSYKTYVAVQNELAAAYHELRDDLSKRYFNQSYDALVSSKAKDKVAAIRAVYPQRISEAEPYTQ